MLEVRYGKTKAKIAALCVIVLYLMELPELAGGIYDVAVAAKGMSNLGLGATPLSAGVVVVYLLPVLGRLVFMLYYLKLMVPLPRDHRKGMLVLMSMSVGFSLVNLIVSAIANNIAVGYVLMSLAQVLISPTVVLLVGLIARRSTEWIAAGSRLLLLGLALIPSLLAGTWPQASTLLSAGLYIAVLLLHPVLERPMFERRVPPVWEPEEKQEGKAHE